MVGGRKHDLVHLTIIFDLTSLLKQVPLGNFEVDWLVFTADVFFSRTLHDQQMVFINEYDNFKNFFGYKT